MSQRPTITIRFPRISAHTVGQFIYLYEVATTITLTQIDERLRWLSPEKLGVVYDFVTFLVSQEQEQESRSGALETMLASEAVLKRDWERPEEDEAWADL